MEVLVITSSKGRWIFPKGFIPKRLGPVAAAVREGREEAGVKGRVFGPCLGEYRYSKDGRSFIVKLFPLRVSKQIPAKRWKEGGDREREWVSVEEAVRRIRYKRIHPMLKCMSRCAGDG